MQVPEQLDSRAADFSGHSVNVLRRGDYLLCRLEREPGERLLLVARELGLEAASSDRRLEHELALRTELHPDWAARPIALTQYTDRPALMLQDPGGELLDQLIEQPLNTK